MNILQLTTHLNIGGIARYITDLAEGLSKKGHKVIVASSGGDLVGQLYRLNIPHIILDIKTKSEFSPKLISAYPRLLSILRKENIEVIHAHTRVTQVLAFFASRFLKIPYITTCHGFFKTRIGRRLFKCWGDETIAISDAVRTHLVNDFNITKEKIHLIYNGINTKRFMKVYSKNEISRLKRAFNLECKIVIGSVGRFSPVKGYNYLIKAFKRLLDRYRDLGLLLVGDGPQKNELVELSKKLGIDRFVTFITSFADVSRVYSIIDIFVASSIQEGLGLSILESLASGKPVVATDVGGISDIIKHRRTGIIVKSQDVEELAKGISLLLDNADLRNSIAALGQKFVKENFNIENAINRVIGLYEKVKS